MKCFSFSNVVLVSIYEKPGKSGEIFKYFVLMDPETFEQCDLIYFGGVEMSQLLGFLRMNVDVILQPNRNGFAGFSVVDIKESVA